MMADLKQMAEGLADLMREYGYEKEGFDDATTVRVALIGLARRLGYVECLLRAYGEDKPPESDDDETACTALRKALDEIDQCERTTLLLTGAIGRETAIDLLTFLNMAQEELFSRDPDWEVGPDDMEWMREGLSRASDLSSYHLLFYEARLLAIASLDFSASEIPANPRWSDAASMKAWEHRFNRSGRTLRDWRNKGRLRMRPDPSGRGWQVHKDDLPDDSA